MNILPREWEIVPFHNIATYKLGRTPSRANDAFWNHQTATIPWVSIADMRPNRVVTRTKENITEKAFQLIFNGEMVPKDTLIMSFKLTIGRVAYLGQDACHNEAIISIFPNSAINKKFLGYYLSQYDFSNLYDRQIKGNTLNKSKIDNIPVILPSLTEQDSITKILDFICKGIEITEEKQHALSELKAASMHKLFTCGLRGEAQKQMEIGLVPESWEVERLGAHYSVASGGTPSRRYKEFWENGTIPWVKTAEVNYSIINKTEECISELGLERSASKIFPAGTLLLAMYGQGVTRGKVALLGMDAACNQACAAMQPTDDNILPEYLYYFLTYRYDAIRILAHGGQQQNLNLDIVKSLNIAFPSDLDEQLEIVSILSAIDQKIDIHRKKKATLEELFKSMLHKLMTGQIRVDDLDLSALEPPQGTRGAP